MIKPLKYATLAQAQEQLNAGGFVYHNPCCVCKKECSTPTLDIWKRRIAEFGNVAAMYANYVCRNCRKSPAAKSLDVESKATEPVRMHVAQEPLPRTMAGAPMMKKKEERPVVQVKPERHCRKPGDALEQRDGEFAFSVWENGEYKGTHWYKIADKKS